MKRWFLLILALVLALSAVSAAVGEEGDFGIRSDGRIQDYFGSGGVVTVPAQVGGEPVYSIYRGTFENNGTITELVFSEGLQSLGEAVCYGMTALEKVTLPETLAVLDEANFTNCGKLTEITLPASLMFVGENCFNWCDALTSVTFRGCAPCFDAYCFTKTAGDLVIYVPDDQLEAYRDALPQGLDIRPSGQNAMIPSYTANLEDFSFDAESGAITAYTGKEACVRVPGEIGGVPVRHIGDYAFEDNDFTYMVFLPEGVESIGYKAFATANALVWVDLPDTLATIGESALSGYWGVRLHWPENLETIEDDAFRNSNFGASARLPHRLKTIGAEAFAKSRLQEVEFPASLQFIGEEAFADSHVTKLYFGGVTLPQIDETAFQGLTITDVEINGKASDQAMEAAQAYLDSLGLNVQVRRRENPDGEISEDDLERYGGVWYLAAVDMGGGSLNPVDLGISMTLTLRSDGTASQATPDGEAVGEWTAWEDGVDVTLDESTVFLALRDGALWGEEEGAALTFTRDAPQPGFVPAEPAEASSAQAFSGVWQAVYLEADGAFFPMDSPQMASDWVTLFGSSDTTIRIEGGQVTYFGQEAAFTFQNGRLENPDSVLDEIISLRGDGTLSLQFMGLTVYCVRAEEESPAPAPIPTEPDPAAGFIGVRYVCVSAEAGGRTLDASMLGAEYAVTFHPDGTADFVLSGVPVPGLNWRMDGDDAVIDYFGSAEMRFTIGDGFMIMDYFGSMLLRFEPAS